MQQTSSRIVQGLITAGKLAEAERQLVQLLSRNPNDADLHNLRGVVHLLDARFDQAVHHFTLAVRADPLCSEYLANLGNAFRRLNRLGDAEAALRKALALSPEHKEKLLFDLGSLLHEKGALAESAVLFREALAIAPDYPKALNDFALVARKLGALRRDPALLNEAEACLEHLQRIDPKFPALAVSRANLIREKARLSAAGGDWEQAKDFCTERRRILGLGEAGAITAVRAPTAAAVDQAEPLRTFRNCRVFPGAKDWFLVDDLGQLHTRGLTNANLEASPWCCIADPTGHTILSDDDAPYDVPAERAVLLGGGDNYWHWMIDYLPRLYYVAGEADLGGLPLLVNQGLTRFQKETLAMLKIPSVRLVEAARDRVARCRELVVPPIGSHETNFDLPALTWLRDALLRNAGNGKKTPRSIYVSRRDAAKRRVLNEKPLVESLRRLGIQAVEFARLRVAEQIRMLSDVDLFVGPHGAAFANILFARPGATIVELVPAGEEYPHYFASLSRALGLDYHAVPCATRNDAAIEKDFSHDLDIVADVDSLTGLLESLVRRRAD